MTLSVAVTGGKEPYSYQWYINYDGKDFRQGDDAKDASYKPWDDPNKYVTLGNYYCVVTDANGTTATSDYAYVYSRLGIFTQPEDQYVKATGYATLSIQAYGGLSPLTYQWQKYSTAGWRNFKTGASVTVEGTQLGTYRCVVTDKSGMQVISNTVIVAEDIPRISNVIHKYQDASYIDFYVRGGTIPDYSVKVWLRNKNGTWKEATFSSKFQVSDYVSYRYKYERADAWAGNWFVILVKDQDGGFAREFYNCVEDDVPEKYKNW